MSGASNGDIVLQDRPGAAGLFRISTHNNAATAVVLFHCKGLNLTLSASRDGLLKVYDIRT